MKKITAALLAIAVSTVMVSTASADPTVTSTPGGPVLAGQPLVVTYAVATNDQATSFPFSCNFRIHYSLDSLSLTDSAVSGGAVESVPTIDGGIGGSMIVGPETEDVDNGGLPNVYRNVVNDGTGYNTTESTPGLFRVEFTVEAAPASPIDITFGPNTTGVSFQWINDPDGPGGAAATLGSFASWTPDYSATTGLMDVSSVADWSDLNY